MTKRASRTESPLQYRPLFALAAAAAFCCGCGMYGGWFCWSRHSSTPDCYPLGAVNRAHYHTMETNAEAADFILHQNEFVASTAELTPYGKDHILEIAARGRCAPFPVIVERSENNSDPELDEHRRSIVAQVLFDCGMTDAQQRTYVAPAYGKALSAHEAESDFHRFQSLP